MKKFVSMLSFVLIAACPAFAITDTTVVLHDSAEVNLIDSITAPLYELLDAAFENLDMEDVTSGYLLNKSFPLIRYELFEE
jgi:hypothetical protein